MSSEDKHNAVNVNRQNGIRLQVYSSWDELASLGTAWEQLLQDSVGPTIFSTPEWLGAWWKAYGQGKQLATVALTNSCSGLVGLVPLYLEELPGWAKRLRLVGDGTNDSDNLDVMFRTGHEQACSDALLAWLASDAAWDLCELNTLPSESPTIQSLLCGLQKQGWVHASYDRPNSAVILPRSWESYLEQLPREHAKGIERYTRRLQRHYAVRIFSCTSEEDLPAHLDTLFDLHQRRWKAQGEPGAFVLPSRRKFYAEMSRAFLRRGWLEFWLLELDGEIAAAQLAFRYGDTLYQLQEGLDPAHFSDRAGHVLRAHIIKQLIASGVRRYDYLAGAETHKRNWGAQPGFYTDIHFAAKPMSRGHFYMHLLHSAGVAREWLHSKAPAAYSVLRGVYYQAYHKVGKEMRAEPGSIKRGRAEL